jgi:hypothetical protein
MMTKRPRTGRLNLLLPSASCRVCRRWMGAVAPVQASVKEVELSAAGPANAGSRTGARQGRFMPVLWRPELKKSGSVSGWDGAGCRGPWRRLPALL